jgi:hypothetical protein
MDKETEHTGVSELEHPHTRSEIEYTYEHVDERPEPESDMYRVVGVLEMVDRPTHKNVYYVPAEELDTFMKNHSPQVAEEFVDVQPISREQAEQELDEYRD